MIKKLSFIVIMSAFIGCSNLSVHDHQTKNFDNAVLAVDKSNTGRICELYPDNQKIKTFGTIVNGKLQGKYNEFYESGKLLLTVNYENGKQNGIVKKYYPDGKVQIKGTMKNDLPDGKFTFFYENGKREAIKNFKNGIYDGYYMEFYQNGIIKVKGYYAEGYKNGTFSFYNENGKKIQEGLYINGSRNGVWKNFDENGKTISSVDYKNIGFINPEDKISAEFQNL